MVFVNLLDNAAKYGAKEPLVHVQASVHRGKRVVIRISDNGKGVNFDLRRKIFKRFYRGGSELERTTKGTGLGLYIVKSLINKMKGKIHTHGRGPLGGATFEVDLPGRALEPPVDETLPEGPPRGAVQGSPAAQEAAVRSV
jgi:signal transduction histidine kinase